MRNRYAVVELHGEAVASVRVARSRARADEIFREIIERFLALDQLTWDEYTTTEGQAEARRRGFFSIGDWSVQRVEVQR